MNMKKHIKWGHQAPPGYRVNRFNHIEINGDFAYCDSHNFVYKPERQEELLYNAQPCYYTDYRYSEGTFTNSFYTAHLLRSRWKDVSLKACIKKTLVCRNIPIGTVVDFGKSWYYVNRKFENGYKFKVKKKIILIQNMSLVMFGRIQILKRQVKIAN